MQLQRFAARGTADEGMATPLQKAKCGLWFNKTKFVKLVQQRYRTESGLHRLSKPSIYGFCKQFRETGKVEISFGEKCMDGTRIPT
jgi:hypothetical protein